MPLGRRLCFWPRCPDFARGKRVGSDCPIRSVDSGTGDRLGRRLGGRFTATGAWRMAQGRFSRWAISVRF